MFIGYLLIALMTLVLYVTLFRAKMNFNFRILAAFFMLLIVLLVIFCSDLGANPDAVEPVIPTHASVKQILNKK